MVVYTWLDTFKMYWKKLLQLVVQNYAISETLGQMEKIHNHSPNKNHTIPAHLLLYQRSKFIFLWISLPFMTDEKNHYCRVFLPQLSTDFGLAGLSRYICISTKSFSMIIEMDLPLKCLPLVSSLCLSNAACPAAPFCPLSVLRFSARFWQCLKRQAGLHWKHIALYLKYFWKSTLVHILQFNRQDRRIISS